MERRLLLAIVLTFIVLTAYQWLVPSPTTSPRAGSPATARAEQVPGAARCKPRGVPAPTPAPLPAVETLKADTAERTVAVDNGLVHAVFSNRGATLDSWALSGYPGPDGKPVDLVPHEVPPNQPKPFSLELDDASKSARLNSALFTTSSGATLDARTAPVTVSFDYEDAAGLRATKQFRIEPIHTSSRSRRQ
jgi:YidC/Oxa1 family membrane protein insertase